MGLENVHALEADVVDHQALEVDSLSLMFHLASLLTSTRNIAGGREHLQHH